MNCQIDLASYYANNDGRETNIRKISDVLILKPDDRRATQIIIYFLSDWVP